MYIFRWVVSSELDLRALEQLSLVCRGFYICARWVEVAQEGRRPLPCPIFTRRNSKVNTSP